MRGGVALMSQPAPRGHPALCRAVSLSASAISAAIRRAIRAARVAIRSSQTNEHHRIAPIVVGHVARVRRSPRAGNSRSSTSHLTTSVPGPCRTMRGQAGHDEAAAGLERQRRSSSYFVVASHIRAARSPMVLTVSNTQSAAIRFVELQLHRCTVFAAVASAQFPSGAAVLRPSQSDMSA